MALKGRQNGQRPHVLALPSPFQGHINPLLELSFKLAAEGIAVSFLNIPHYHSRIAPSLQPLLDRASLPIRFVSLSGVHLLPPDLREPGSLERCFRHISTDMWKEVEDVMYMLMKQDDGTRPACLLVDVRIPFAQYLSDKFSIPRIAFWTQSAASLSYHAVVAEGFQLPPPTDDLSVIDCVPGVPVHTARNAPSMFRGHPDVHRDILFDFIMKPFPAVKNALGLVINTFESLEPEAIDALCKHGFKPLAIGPLLPQDNLTASASPFPKHTLEPGAEEKHMCLQWLDVREAASVLYISFGTVASLDDGEFEELTLGIEASEQSFLWSLRPDVVGGDASSFIKEFKQRTEQRGLVLPWVPQLEVLSHKSIGGFMTHCGWNSALESMCRGVPMIGRPKFGDQELNVICLVDGWKVCLAMEGKGGGLQRDEVERKVRTLFTGPEVWEMRRLVERLRDEAACAVLEKGTSWANLKLVLKLISQAHISACS